MAGSGEFGVPTLERLADRLVMVVTGPERPAGRGRKPCATPVAAAAARHGLPLLCTDNINHPDSLAALAAAGPATLLVVDFGQLLGAAARRAAGGETLNIHPSLLPLYRGAAPIERALQDGARETGVTIIRLQARLDAGPIMLQERVPVGNEENAVSLHARLADRAAVLAETAMAKLAAGEAAFTPQDERAATFAPPLRKEEACLDWRKDARQLAAEVRAFAAWPRAYTRLPVPPGTRLVVTAARPEAIAVAAAPGTVIAADTPGILVACGRGALRLTRLQAAGRRAVSGAEFCRGCPSLTGQVLG